MAVTKAEDHAAAPQAKAQTAAHGAGAAEHAAPAAAPAAAAEPEAVVTGRKIVQAMLSADDRLVAVCADGTAWVLHLGGSSLHRWSELPIIPK